MDKDIMSKSDPCAVLYMFMNGRYEEVSVTVALSWTELDLDVPHIDNTS